MKGTGLPDLIRHWGIRVIMPVMCGWKENFPNAKKALKAKRLEVGVRLEVGEKVLVALPLISFPT